MKHALLILEKMGGYPVKEFIEKIRNTKGVLDVYVVFGRYDAISFIESKTDKLLKEKIREIENIEGMLFVESLLNIN